MATTRYRGQPLPIVLVYPDNPLTIYGKTYADIEEISMNLKRNLATDDDDAYLEVTQTGGGVSLAESTHTFTMTMGDYQKAIVGDYHLVLAIKVAGISDMIEPIIDDDIISITPDKQRH